MTICFGIVAPVSVNTPDSDKLTISGEQRIYSKGTVSVKSKR